jgi:hypothetical protein
MLKIRGNKEFVQWWDHWMARIHPHRSGPQTTPTALPEQESGREKKERANRQQRDKDTVQSTPSETFFRNPVADSFGKNGRGTPIS